MEKAKERLPYEAKPWLQTDVRPLVRLRNVSKRFGGFTAVSNISLDIYKGELFCLLGGSGCGKTTLLRQLAGFEELSDGSIEIDGQQMAAVSPHLRPVNMMFQSYALFPHMNVQRNVAYGLQREGLAASEIASRVEYMLDLVKLAGYEKRSPSELSGGQCQRVALARALVKRPKLLLLDEPLAALDKKLRVETQLELVKIQETLGTTFIVVTHDQEEAMTIATRIGVMDAGEIVQVGEPQEMYEYPRNRFVASFIGSVNIFEGTVVASEADHLRIRSEEASCSIYVPHGLGCTVGQRLWYAVRPEKLTASSTQPEQDSNWLAGKIDDIAYLGDVTSYRIVLPSGKIVHVSRMNESRSMRAPLTWDDHAYISWDANSGVVLLS